MAEVVFEGVGEPVNNDTEVVYDGVGNPVRNDPDVVLDGIGQPILGPTNPDNNDGGPGAFPGFGGAPPDVAAASAAGGSGLASRSDHTHGGLPVAPWSENSYRYFALDYDGGNDANTGFSDADMAASGLVAKKTYGAIMGAIQKLGAGRAVLLAIKPRAGGAVYKKADGVTDDVLVWRGFVGYRSILIEGTTDFSNTATDKVLAGAMIAAAGPNGDSSWTVGAGATTTSVPLNAGAFPADPAISLKRVRWITGALAGQVNWVRKQTTADFEPGVTLAGAPAQGDTFVIEQPGVAFSKVQISGDGATVNSLPEQSGVDFILKGIAAVSNTSSAWGVRGPLRRVQIGFCEARGGTASRSVFSQCGTVRPSRIVTDETGASITVGVGYRESGGLSFVDDEFLFGNSFGSAGSATTQISAAQRMQVTTGRHRGGVVLSGLGSLPVGAPTLTGAGDLCEFGNTSTVTSNERMLVDGPTAAVGLVHILGGSVTLVGCELINAGALPAIRVNAVGASIRLDDVIGSSGNTDVGLDMTAARKCSVSLADNNLNTVTGSNGDIRVSSGGIVTHAQAAKIISDTRENVLVGTSGPVPQTLIDGANISTNLAAADLRKMQEYDVTLAGNRIMDAPTNPVDGQTFVYRLQNDNGARIVTWTTGAGAFLFGLSIPAINVVLGTAGANSYDLVAFRYNLALNRHCCVGFVAGFV